MSIEKRIKKIVIEKNKEFKNNSEFQKLNDFYEKMKKAGLAQKQKYNIEPIDTIGMKYRSDFY